MVGSFASGQTSVFLALIMVAGCAAATAALIHLLIPYLRRYRLARPNARSSHSKPTPEGGGIAVMLVVIAAVLLAMFVVPLPAEAAVRLPVVLAMAAVLAFVGALDDKLSLEILPRLLLQILVAAVVVTALPPDLRVVQLLPWWFERALLLVGLIWFVNLTNFMDGIDWMTVAEFVPLTAALSLMGLTATFPAEAILVALALLGAMLGFAPYNRPVARLFLGDVGSLPCGLLLGWLLILLAGSGQLIAALLLPLYYLADTTITLFRRMTKGERFLQAHRTHFYQRARDHGYSVFEVASRVFAVNLALTVLAAGSVFAPSITLRLAALAAGCVLVGLLLWSFSRSRR